MSGKMPFLFRFMARKMESMIGRDYELGFGIAEWVPERKRTTSRLHIQSVAKTYRFQLLGHSLQRQIASTRRPRRSSIETLRAAGTEAQYRLALTLYHHFDPLASHFQTEIAIPIGDQAPLSNYTRREFKGGRYFKMTLHGDHRFLPLGWYALYSHCRHA